MATGESVYSLGGGVFTFAGHGEEPASAGGRKAPATGPTMHQDSSQVRAPGPPLPSEILGWPAPPRPAPPPRAAACPPDALRVPSGPPRCAPARRSRRPARRERGPRRSRLADSDWPSSGACRGRGRRRGGPSGRSPCAGPPASPCPGAPRIRTGPPLRRPPRPIAPPPPPKAVPKQGGGAD